MKQKMKTFVIGLALGIAGYAVFADFLGLAVSLGVLGGIYLYFRQQEVSGK